MQRWLGFASASPQQNPNWPDKVAYKLRTRQDKEHAAVTQQYANRVRVQAQTLQTSLQAYRESQYEAETQLEKGYAQYKPVLRPPGDSRYSSKSVLEAEQAVAASLEQVRSVLDTAPVHKGWLQAQLQDSCVTPQGPQQQLSPTFVLDADIAQILEQHTKGVQHKAERQACKVGDLQSALSDHRPLAKQLSLAFQELHGMKLLREADRSRIADLSREVEQLKKSGSMQEAWLTAAKADASSQAAARQRLQEGLEEEQNSFNVQLGALMAAADADQAAVQQANRACGEAHAEIKMLQGLVQAAQAQWELALDHQATLEDLLATAEDCAAKVHQQVVQISSTNGCDAQLAELSIMPHGVYGEYVPTMPFWDDRLPQEGVAASPMPTEASSGLAGQALDNSLQSKQVQEANLPEVAYQGVDLKAKLPEAAQPGVDLKGKLPSLQPVDGPIKAGRGQSAATALDDQGSFAQDMTCAPAQDVQLEAEDVAPRVQRGPPQKGVVVPMAVPGHVQSPKTLQVLSTAAAAVTIQAAVRGYLCRQRQQQLKSAAVLVQARWRGHSCHQNFQLHRRLAASFRAEGGPNGRLTRLDFLRLKEEVCKWLTRAASQGVDAQDHVLGQPMSHLTGSSGSSHAAATSEAARVAAEGKCTALPQEEHPGLFPHLPSGPLTPNLPLTAADTPHRAAATRPAKAITTSLLMAAADDSGVALAGALEDDQQPSGTAAGSAASVASATAVVASTPAAAASLRQRSAAAGRRRDVAAAIAALPDAAAATAVGIAISGGTTGGAVPPANSPPATDATAGGAAAGHPGRPSDTSPAIAAAASAASRAPAAPTAAVEHQQPGPSNPAPQRSFADLLRGHMPAVQQFKAVPHQAEKAAAVAAPAGVEAGSSSLVSQEFVETYQGMEEEAAAEGLYEPGSVLKDLRVTRDFKKQVRKQFSKLSLDEWESPATFLDELLQLSSEDEVIEACVDLGCDPEPAAKLAQLLMRKGQHAAPGYVDPATRVARSAALRRSTGRASSSAAGGPLAYGPAPSDRPAAIPHPSLGPAHDVFGAALSSPNPAVYSSEDASELAPVSPAPTSLPAGAAPVITTSSTTPSSPPAPGVALPGSSYAAAAAAPRVPSSSSIAGPSSATRAASSSPPSAPAPADGAAMAAPTGAAALGDVPTAPLPPLPVATTAAARPTGYASALQAPSSPAHSALLQTQRQRRAQQLPRQLQQVQQQQPGAVAEFAWTVQLSRGPGLSSGGPSLSSGGRGGGASGSRPGPSQMGGRTTGILAKPAPFQAWAREAVGRLSQGNLTLPDDLLDVLLEMDSEDEIAHNCAATLQCSRTDATVFAVQLLRRLRDSNNTAQEGGFIPVCSRNNRKNFGSSRV